MSGGVFDPGAPVAYAWAGAWLDAYVEARAAHNGDAFVALFDDHAVLQAGPFGPPVSGSNAIRAYLGRCAEVEAGLDLTIERHWVSGATILAAWNATLVRRLDRAHVQEAGFLTAAITSGLCSRLRLWTVAKGGATG